ncbi:MAG: CvpA family protein [Saprospiraceae bacterium]|nr:CvpA family protein [Saprospiraceae bacterium]MDW8228714.1 CvpA family protein [Saprospiraceae bacterium]
MIIDILAAAFALLGFWYGKDRGIFGIVFWFLSVTFGLVLAYKMAPTMARILKAAFESDSPIILPIAFIVNVLFIWGLFRAAGKGASGVFQMFRIGFINRTIGGLLGASIALLLYGSMLWFLQRTHIIGEQTASESKTLKHLVELPEYAGTYISRLKPFMREAWEAGSKWIEAVQKYGDEKTQNMDTSSPSTDGEARIYKIEEGADGRIEKKPQDTRAKNRELYEDTGIEY